MRRELHAAGMQVLEALALNERQARALFAALAAVEKFATWVAAADREKPDEPHEHAWEPTTYGGGSATFGKPAESYHYERCACGASRRVEFPPADREKPDRCRAPHCFSEYGTPCGTCPAEKPETP